MKNGVMESIYASSSATVSDYSRIYGRRSRETQKLMELSRCKNVWKGGMLPTQKVVREQLAGYVEETRAIELASLYFV